MTGGSEDFLYLKKLDNSFISKKAATLELESIKKKKMRNDDNLIPGACNKYNQTVFMSYTQIILINR